MCGICGIFRTDSLTVDPNRVKAMRDIMFSRGPDDAGLSTGAGFGLGHRRLSIIDLSEHGRQPMSAGANLEVVFNGEIYNFQELRAELEHSGQEFRTKSDTEVLLLGYRAWGINELVTRLRGMFAFALLDHNKGQIHLARDPLGKKPLFYCRTEEGELLFASSGRALVKGLTTTPEVNPRAVDDLLWNLYIPGPDTIFKGVKKLPPGTLLSYDKQGSSRERSYWQPDFIDNDFTPTPEEWLDRVDNALRKAIRRRFVADVPVGVLLSGGIDSGLVAALGAQECKELQTFSVATDDPELDESSYAAEVARMYNTNHKTLAVHGSERRNLARLVQSMGEPFADASAINVQAIAEVAQQSVKVVLTGDGGDEAFGGYSFFWAAHHASPWRKNLPAMLRPLVASMGRSLRGNSIRSLSRAGTFLNYVGGPVNTTFVSWNDDTTRNALFTPAFRDMLNSHHPDDHYTRIVHTQDHSALLVDRLMDAHIQTILPDDYLAKVDLATMSVSLEARSPFMDLDLFELAMRIPDRVRFAGGKPKSLLRTLAVKYLPPDAAARPKLGFVTPIGKWLRDDWRDLVDAYVLGPAVENRGWFQRKALEEIVERQRGGANYDYVIWSLLVLELWMQMTVDETLAADAVL
ncbi:MAG: asparagine synthase (glutamine-hydrolyzing) [Chromatiales bacterium]|nr:asparagine synthase (glutamine-hydrolyzing) [Chromatiales bacterium]